ncbi:Uncharacterised protein [Bordetella pertussis]|nr:Uncharacterised protein [Bordetella pertussis]
MPGKPGSRRKRDAPLSARTQKFTCMSIFCKE